MTNKRSNGINGKPRVLIVYYSHSGNTRALARLIQHQTGGDLLEIEPVVPYPADYDAVVKQAKEELQAGYQPPLKTGVVNPESYDVILAGSPNWWNTLAPPLHTFLSQGDLSGKIIAPFITHEGTGLGKSAADIAWLCPGAKILEGLAVRGEKVNGAQREVAEWLRRSGMFVVV